jgi:hypothetical protein
LATLRRRVAAIARAHRIAKQPLDTRNPAIRETLRATGRTPGEPPRRSAALATTDIKQLLTVCGDDTAGIRDQAPSSASPARSVGLNSSGSMSNMSPGPPRASHS